MGIQAEVKWTHWVTWFVKGGLFSVPSSPAHQVLSSALLLKVQGHICKGT